MIATLTERDEAFEVWPENWDGFCAFLCVQTQWRATPGLHGQVYWQGLDYAGVAAGLNGCGVAATPAVWEQLRSIETAARDVLNGVG